MIKTVRNQLNLTNNLLTIADEQGRPLLADCYASMQLQNGTTFSMHAMECTNRISKHRILVYAGGNAVLPRMELRATLLTPYSATVALSVTNTTPEPLYIERLDALVSRGGYRSIPTKELHLRRTGWQMSTPAAVRTPFISEDPWLQPPLHMPMVLPSSADQRHLPWMTVLQSVAQAPLLIGFGSAKDYLGIISLRTSSTGHRLTASNYLEGITLEPGQTVTSEPLVIAWGKPEPELLDTYASFVANTMSARIPERPPTGWSHWLYYFQHVTEQDILENTSVIAEKDLPFEYIQIDDGYQTAFGDWLSVKDTFPSGMQHIAATIRKTGRKPGIWLSPFMADARSQLYKEHPDWFLHDYNGRIINVNRHGDPYWPAPNYGLDITHPGAYAWLKQVFTTVCKDWKYDYLKLDFLYAGAIRAKRYDPNCTSVQAYRRGMQLIRDIAGDRVILGCGAPFICSVGLVDTMRIGPDLSWEFDLPNVKRPVDYTLPRSRDPLQSLLSHMWMNRKLWINDADYVRVRQHHISLGWTETVALTSLIALGGGVLYDSDKLVALEDEGYALLDRLFPVADVTTRPVGNITTDKPAKLLARSQKGDGVWHIAARFNWHSQPIPSHFYPKRWELPVGRYHVYDLLRQQYLGMHHYTRLPDVDPKGVSLFSLCLAIDHPQVVATEGHLLGPAGDIATTVWHDNTLTITLRDGRRTDTQLYVHVPLGYRLERREDCVVTQKQGTVYKLQPTENTCKLICTPLTTQLRKSSR